MDSFLLPLCLRTSFWFHRTITYLLPSGYEVQLPDYLGGGQVTYPNGSWSWYSHLASEDGSLLALATIRIGCCHVAIRWFLGAPILQMQFLPLYPEWADGLGICSLYEWWPLENTGKLVHCVQQLSTGSSWPLGAGEMLLILCRQSTGTFFPLGCTLCVSSYCLSYSEY